MMEIERNMCLSSVLLCGQQKTNLLNFFSFLREPSISISSDSKFSDRFLITNGILITKIIVINKFVRVVPVIAAEKFTKVQPHRSRLMEGRESSLTLAVKEDDPEKVASLLATGLNANEIDVTGISPFFRAIRDNKFLVVQAFAQNKNTDIRNFKNKHGISPLIVAIEHDVSIGIIECLLATGVDINEKQSIRTPLAWASKVGNLKTVKFLIENGADINLTGLNGNTPLGTASQFHRPAVAKFLLAQNADIDKFEDSEDGGSPLHLALLNREWRMLIWLLEKGAQISNRSFLAAIQPGGTGLVQFLIDRGAHINRLEGDFEETPLQRAIEVRSMAIVRMLLNNGARVVEDLYHQEIARILEVLRDNNIGLVKMLVENGARVNEMAPNGDTLLTGAIKHKKFELVKHLIKHGADPNRPDRRGKSPLAIAHFQPARRIFQHLVASGATVSEVDRRIGILVMNFDAERQRILGESNQRA